MNPTNSITKMNKSELLEKCQELGISKCRSKNKSQLFELIREKTKQDGQCTQNSKDSKGTQENAVQTQIEDLETTVCTTSSNEKCSASSNYTFVEVCSGGGGLSAGLIKSGFTPLLLNDNNSDCCETLRKNHPNVNVVLGSMDKISYEKYIDKIDLLTGGVPCQSFSQAGLRKGLEDPRGDLMIKFIDIINLTRPRVFMIENVKGLLTHDDGKTISKIIEAMNHNGLYTIEFKCLDSSKYGVPQKRERVFIVGILKTMESTFHFPEESLNKKMLKDVLLDVPASFGAKYPESKIHLFKMIPQGGCWVNLPENLQKEYLGNSFYSGGGKRGILHRLSMEKPSLTLLCTPSQKQTDRCHPLEERPLTVREYARIQTFDDDYEFVGSMNSQYKQIGNAVPVELARHMGEAIVRVLQKK